MKRLVYRLESYDISYTDTHKNVNVGAYRADIDCYTISWSDDDSHPGPMQEPNLKHWFDETKHVFGFISLKSLSEWFDDYSGMCDMDVGSIARIGVYEVSEEHLHIGEKQCIMDSRYVKLVKVLKCEDAFKEDCLATKNIDINNNTCFNI